MTGGLAEILRTRQAPGIMLWKPQLVHYNGANPRDAVWVTSRRQFKDEAEKRGKFIMER